MECNGLTEDMWLWFVLVYNFGSFKGLFFFLVEMARILYDCNSFLCIGVCQSVE